MDNQDAEKPRRISITKTQRESEIGIELISLCQSLSEDGSLSAAEIHDLHQWLEENQSSDLPAIGFLVETVRKVIEDGRISLEESRAVYKALEAVLPPDLRKEAISRRRTLETEERNKLRVTREHENQQQREERERNRAVGSWNFMVAGVRHENRPALIAQHVRAEADAYLKRDIANKFSRNAVEVRTESGVPIGYVPEELATEIAPLLDRGCRHQAYFTKVLSGGHSPIPVVQAYLYGADATLEGAVLPEEIPRSAATVGQPRSAQVSRGGTVSNEKLDAPAQQTRRPSKIAESSGKSLGRLVGKLLAWFKIG